MVDETNKITRSKRTAQLLSSEVRYRRLFETAKDGILIVNADTRKIIDANPFIIELLGYSRDELIGHELWEIGLLKDVKDSRRAFRELKDKGFIRYDHLPLQTKDGELREVEFVSNVYLEGGQQVVQCNIRDITERRQAEQHLRHINGELKALIAELHRRDADMLRLNRLYEVLQACSTEGEAYAVIALAAGELFGGLPGCLAILDASQGHLKQAASWGKYASGEAFFLLQDCWALRRDHLHEVKNAQSGLMCGHFVQTPDTGYLCVPLAVHGETLGVLTLLGTDVWTGEHRIGKLRLVAAVAEAIKMALSKLRLQAKLSEQAVRDPLTGLLNRRFLEETLSREVFRAQRANSQMCVAMLDLDNFKQFNDGFGHRAGDSILRNLGRLMRETLRKSDILCRYGGDEFVLVLFDSPLADTQKRVEQICEAVREMHKGDVDPKVGPITMSAGIAQARVHASDPDELLRLADKALYAAKAAGGDRVAIHQENEPWFKTGG